MNVAVNKRRDLSIPNRCNPRDHVDRSAPLRERTDVKPDGRVANPEADHTRYTEPFDGPTQDGQSRRKLAVRSINLGVTRTVARYATVLGESYVTARDTLIAHTFCQAFDAVPVD
jgi:hypothetical protein